MAVSRHGFQPKNKTFVRTPPPTLPQEERACASLRPSPPSRVADLRLRDPLLLWSPYNIPMSCEMLGIRRRCFKSARRLPTTQEQLPPLLPPVRLVNVQLAGCLSIFRALYWHPWRKRALIKDAVDCSMCFGPYEVIRLSSDYLQASSRPCKSPGTLRRITLNKASAGL